MPSPLGVNVLGTTIVVGIMVSTPGTYKKLYSADAPPLTVIGYWPNGERLLTVVVAVLLKKGLFGVQAPTRLLVLQIKQ